MVVCAMVAIYAGLAPTQQVISSPTVGVRPMIQLPPLKLDGVIDRRAKGLEKASSLSAPGVHVSQWDTYTVSAVSGLK